MKRILILSLFFCYTISVQAQQKSNINDSTLLDYYQNQRFTQAADYLKKTYPEPVTDIKVLGKMAYAFQMAGKLADAESYYQRMYSIDSINISVLFNLGSINLRRGNNTRAEIYYKIISAKDTTNFMVFKQLGIIEAGKKDTVATVNYLQKANNINSTDPDVASDLSDVYVTLMKYKQAEKVLTNAITADPDNVFLLQSLLKLTLAQKNYKTVRDVCLKLISLNINVSQTLTILGQAYYNLKDYTCAVETFADLPPFSQSETGCYFAAMAYKELKDQQLAIENFSRAIEIGISPNINNYYSQIADSYTIKKKYKKAIAAYQKALQFAETPITYYLIANIYDDNLRNKKQALKYYKKYVSNKPPVKEKKYFDYAHSQITVLSR